MDSSSTIKVAGHNVQIGDKNLWFAPGSKAVVIREKGRKDRTAEGRAAVKLRTAVKDLHDHAAVLNVSKYSFWDRFRVRFNQSPALTAPTLTSKAETIGKHFSRGVLAVFVLLKGLDLSKYAVNFFVKAPHLAPALNAIAYCSAVFQLVEGSLSAIFGGLELYQGIKQYQMAKRVHDENGMMIAKQRIVFGLVYIAEGALWITLAALFIAFPHLATAYCVATVVCTVLQYIFRAVFVADSATSLAIAVKTLKCIEKYRLKYESGILKNEKLSIVEKHKAVRRFIHRLMNVTEEEKVKISEKCRANPSQITKRLHEKLTKKRLIARRLGIEENLLMEKNDRALFEKVQKSFKINSIWQKASKYISVVFTIANIAGFPISAIDFSKIF